LAIDVFVQFAARTGKREELREELTRILRPTREEEGCVAIHLYESWPEAGSFLIHSQWKDAAAFDRHAQLPHMTRFLGLVAELTTHPVEAKRCGEIG
jgi:quinol monooxygenase YgiN